MLQLPILKRYIHYQKEMMSYITRSCFKTRSGRIATAHLKTSSFKILISATAFKQRKLYKLIAFQNVNGRWMKRNQEYGKNLCIDA
jgi:hypothetical protein